MSFSRARRLCWAVAIAVAALATGTSAVDTASAAVPASEPVPVAATRYVSLVAGRAFFQAADRSCVAYPDSVTVDLLEVADALRHRARPLAVYGTIQGSFIKESERFCPGLGGYHDIYPSWSDMATLRDAYGWSWGSNGRDLKFLARPQRTLAERWNTSCGALRDLRTHGHHRGWALFAYPGGGYPKDVDDTVQRDVVSKCFSFARVYTDFAPYERNQRADEGSRSANPLGYQWTHNVYGGRCNLVAAPCFAEAVRPEWRYESPADLATHLAAGADEWSVLQFHAFVTGRRTAGVGDHWDCSGSDWRAHWTSRPELYCFGDFIDALDAIPPDVVVADPVTVATAWNRTMPRPVITSVAPATAAAGETVTVTGRGFRAVGSPTDRFLGGNGLTVRIGGTRARVTSATGTRLTVVAPTLRTVGPVAVQVVNGDGTAHWNRGALTYRASTRTVS